MQQPAPHLPFEAVTERLSAYADEDLDGVLIKIDWDFPHVIRSSDSANDGAWSAEAHVVMLTDLATRDNLMATTCKEYLMKNWDTIWSQTVLELLDRFKKKTTQVERTEPYLLQSILSTVAASFLGPGAAIVAAGLHAAGATIAAWNDTHARIHNMPSERTPDMDAAGKTLLILIMEHSG
jgi:hypothetical protein